MEIFGLPPKTLSKDSNKRLSSSASYSRRGNSLISFFFRRFFCPENIIAIFGAGFQLVGPISNWSDRHLIYSKRFPRCPQLETLLCQLARPRQSNTFFRALRTETCVDRSGFSTICSERSSCNAENVLQRFFDL